MPTTTTMNDSARSWKSFERSSTRSGYASGDEAGDGEFLSSESNTANDDNGSSSIVTKEVVSTSCGATTTSTSTTSARSRNSLVYGNLMRSRRQKDPNRYYQVVQILGEGSMGSVAKVKKRDECKGGSARKSYVQQEQGCCKTFLSWMSIPSIAPKFNDHHHHDDDEDVLSPLSSSSSTNKTVSITKPTATDIPSSHSAHTRHSIITNNDEQPNKKRKKFTSKDQRSSSLISYKTGQRDQTYYALKSIHLDRCTRPELARELENEVAILKSLDHPNIVRAMETYRYHDRLYLVLELCSGGDLYERDPYTEDQAKRIVRSILSAVSYLHDHNIVHRDLKYENIMFSDTRPDAEIKLIDFGLSQKFARDEHLKDAVGTVYTMAPELLAGDYDAKADVWSVGVLTFMLLSSSLPFYGKDRVQVISKILSGKFSFSSRRWRRVGTDAKVFVRDLLELDPSIRPTAKRALELSWLSPDEEEQTEDAETSMNGALDNIQANIQAFSEYSKLKKLALMVIAYKSTSVEVGQLKELFTKFDANGTGDITLDEFKSLVSSHYDYSEAELESMFNGIDIDGSGLVHYCEFLAATMESHGAINEERIAEAFDRIDADDTGYITVSNLRDLLEDDIPPACLEEIIDEADIEGDHRISYEEFLCMWNGDSDSVLADSKINVQAKRFQHRQSSMNSSFMSSLSGELTDSERVNSSADSPRRKRDPGSGSKAFIKQKREVSVRGQWV